LRARRDIALILLSCFAVGMVSLAVAASPPPGAWPGGLRAAARGVTGALGAPVSMERLPVTLGVRN